MREDWEHDGAEPLRIVLANYVFGAELADPDALLNRYHALTGWANALADARGDIVAVVQRFSRQAIIRRGRVDYHFVADGAPPNPSVSFSGSSVAGIVGALEPSIVNVEGLIFPMVVQRLRWALSRNASIFVRDHGGFEAHASGFRRWYGRMFYRFGFRAADGFFFTAREQSAPWLRAKVIVGREAVHELPEASTDLASWPIPAHAERRLPGRPSLLWVGRLDSNKDPLTMLDGFERACAALPDSRLTFVYGDDGLLADVESRIAHSPELRARVHLRGRVERSALPALYSGADLFVLGSHHEVACFSLIEALSFGVTPVVTDIPAFQVITDNGRLGALFRPGDAAALARAIEQVARNDLVGSRGAVLTHFERELSWSALARKALAVYRRSAAARVSSRRGSLNGSRSRGCLW